MTDASLLPRSPGSPCRRLVLAAGLALATSFATACATNPVTGQRELILMSEEREAAVGAQAAREVQQTIGLVDAPDLSAYVERIGQRLATHSPRQSVPYRFYVADMVEPNAFALPGGYIYVSRGLLVLSNSEAELANVIGHEIGHVAARHSAQRETRSAGVGILSVLGTVAAAAIGGAEAAQAVSQLGQVAGAGLIASYGRDQERQADEIGQNLAADAGWNPAAMADFFEALQRYEAQRLGGPRLPSFLDSHPLSSEREETTAARARSLVVDPAPPIAGTKAAFYETLEGLLVGPDPREGVFRDALFLHPVLDFAVRFPSGWQTVNQPSFVGAQSPSEDAQILLESQGARADPRDAATRFAQQNDLRLVGGRWLRIGGFDAYTATAVAATQQGELAADLTWIEHPEGTFRITGLTSTSRERSHAATFRDTAESFRALDAEERASIREQRLAVAFARAGESLAALSRRTDNRWSVEETALANGLPVGVSLSDGQPVKIAVDHPFRP